ncbi:mono/diheme cytochrome c family protein [Sphingomonas vulcanisoli]|uniref:Mono/diheme cytochrome c family protein n=1 Tax=Sphingomonas vulcanisoli TaxID=1658060 RepID=A0ABX0TMN3_9SPHN|nr:cytochrome c [Sphingomonas vulcanisoli]NIJ06773.1 mono/diheme cytochrome c family protein [Sphingomonas vulcanisoli]
MRKTLILSLALLAAAPVIAQQASKTNAPVMGGDSTGSATHSTLPADGEGLYRGVCQSCHMPDGKGGTGAGTIPALAGNPRLTSSAYVILMVGQGRGGMPGFADLMTPAQIGEVARYVCTHFGNRCQGDASPETVKRVLASISHRPA